MTTGTDSWIESLPPILDELERKFSSAVIVFTGGVNMLSIPILLRALQSVQRQDLCLVLNTHGGEVLAARKIAILIRRFAKKFRVVVPIKAWSAGTILCLSADEIILGSIAELSPIDPQLSALPGNSNTLPNSISSEDVRQFPQMAHAWFNINTTTDALSLFGALQQRVFPTMLSNFFRADRITRRIAEELLSLRNISLGEAQRHELVRKMVEDFDSHEFPILFEDVLGLGLPARPLDFEEETALWLLVNMLGMLTHVTHRQEEYRHVIASKQFIAERKTTIFSEPETSNLSSILSNDLWEIHRGTF